MNVSYKVGGMNQSFTVSPPVSPVQQVAGEPFSQVGRLAATLTIASAATIGANLVDVRDGAMTMPQAIFNGLAKGAAVSYILSRTTRSTTGEVLVAAGLLAGAGYLIDSQMKKRRLQAAESEGE